MTLSELRRIMVPGEKSRAFYGEESKDEGFPKSGVCYINLDGNIVLLYNDDEDEISELITPANVNCFKGWKIELNCQSKLGENDKWELVTTRTGSKRVKVTRGDGSPNIDYREMVPIE